jgi:uncharacterized protein (TIGR02391 family)
MAGRPSLSSIPLVDLVLDMYLESEDVADLLSNLGDLTSGTKPERISRLKQSKGFDPKHALRKLSRAKLAELCRQRNRSDKGTPKMLVARLSDVVSYEASQLLKSSQTRPEDAAASWWELIHPRVRLSSESIFASGNLSPSVLQAFISLIARVKECVRSKGVQPRDGTPLMRQALDSDPPLIRFPSPNDDSAGEIQEGYGHIFAGSMLAVRDPKAHQPIAITQDQAIHLLFLASLLMYKLDEAGVP